MSWIRAERVRAEGSSTYFFRPNDTAQANQVARGAAAELVLLVAVGVHGGPAALVLFRAQAALAHLLVAAGSSSRNPRFGKRLTIQPTT